MAEKVDPVNCEVLGEKGKFRESGKLLEISIFRITQFFLRGSGSWKLGIGSPFFWLPIIIPKALEPQNL